MRQSAYLLERDSIVGQIQETIVSNGLFGDLDQLCSYGGIRRVDEGELDGMELGIVQVLGRFRRWDPSRNLGFLRMIRGVERGGHSVSRMSLAVMLQSQRDIYPAPVAHLGER